MAATPTGVVSTRLAGALTNQGNLLRELGRTDEACAVLTRAVVHTGASLSNTNQNYYGDGDVCIVLPKLDGSDHTGGGGEGSAGTEGTDAQRSAPALPEAHAVAAALALDARGLVHHDRDRLAAAEADFAAAAGLRPKMLLAHYHHGIVLRLLGRHADADRSFGRAGDAGLERAGAGAGAGAAGPRADAGEEGAVTGVVGLGYDERRVAAKALIAAGRRDDAIALLKTASIGKKSSSTTIRERRATDLVLA